MSPESLQNLLAVAIGFSFAGLLCSAYRMFTSQLPALELLHVGRTPAKLAAVPLLVMSAPFLIMRNTLLDDTESNSRFQFVFMATLIAGFWSLGSGMLVVGAARVVGLLAS